MTSPATRRPTGRFTIHQSGADQLAMRAARKVAAQAVAAAPVAPAAAHHTTAARVAQAIQAGQAILAAEAAREADRLYAACFGAAAAAHDLPVPMPTTGPHPDASTMTQAEQDALYASCWPERATTEAPDPLYDALFGKNS